jgi:hypothetical protein
MTNCNPTPLTAYHDKITLCFLSGLARAQKILKFLSLHTNGTFAFAPIHEDIASAKSKEPFLANAPFNIANLHI